MTEETGVLEQATSLERRAHELRSKGKTEEAFVLFDEAASFYRTAGESLKAALCFASAATCWNIHTGWQPLHNAATRSDYAAREALKAKHYDYARSLFREAALLYEKEGDHEGYSECFWQSQIADAKRSWEIFFHKKNERGLADLSENVKWHDRAAAFLRWALNIFGRFTWGYGERPFRTLILAGFIIVVSAWVYFFSGKILHEGGVGAVSFPEALYLSIITYSTVGFGDYLPMGWTRIFASGEALAGIFLTPLFLVGLTRRYLRMYR
jgi:tetratricopeptide (TPR) repeat protein